MKEPRDPAAAYAALHYGLANAIGMSPQEDDDTLLTRVRQDRTDAVRLRAAVVVLPVEKRRRLRARKGGAP